MRARGFRPSFFAFSADMTSTAAAPSLSGQALPAVTVPSGLNAGLSSASFSTVVPGRGPSSWVTSVPSSSVTGDDLAVEVARVAGGDGALLRDRGPLVLRLARDVAAVGDVLGGQAHRDVDVERARPRSRRAAGGTGIGESPKRETASTPAAMYWSPSPALMAWKAIRSVCSEEAQKRLTVVAGT